MRDLQTKLSTRIVGAFLVVLPVATFASISLVTNQDDDPSDHEAVAFVLNNAPENLEEDPESAISARPPVAPAPTPETPTTAAPEPANPAIANAARSPEERGQAALAQIDFPWKQRLPTWEISFHPERSGAYGYTLVREQRIEVYVRGNQSDELLAHVVAHEIGHAIDVTHNRGDERDQWLTARGIQGAPWWPGDGAADFSTGAGDFAESFAAWQVGVESYRSKLGPAPTRAQLDLLQHLALS